MTIEIEACKGTGFLNRNKYREKFSPDHDAKLPLLNDKRGRFIYVIDQNKISVRRLVCNNIDCHERLRSFEGNEINKSRFVIQKDKQPFLIKWKK